MTETSSPDRSLIVYGATGFTGTLVCQELARRGLPFVAAARDHQKLKALAHQLKRAYGVQPPWRVASPNMPSSLDAMLEGGRALISCAGPFIDCGPPVARAALRKRVHYLDTTGEQPFMAWARQELGEQAAQRGLVLAPAMAYEYALGDLACAIAASHGHHHLVVCYAARDLSPSHGTQKSMVRVASQSGLTFLRQELVSRSPGYRSYRLEFPDGRWRLAAWIPGGESLSVPQHSPKTLTVETSMTLQAPLAAAMPAISPYLPSLASRLGGLADALIERATSPDPHDSGRPSTFDVLVCDHDTGALLVALSGVDPYVATARVAVEAAARLMRQEPRAVGYTSAAALFEPEPFIEALDLKLTLGQTLLAASS